MASFGRRVERAGLKLIAIFPYAFVDTSEAWFEPRRRRIAVSAAGPVSDFSLGAVFALCALLLPDGRRARHLLQPRVRRLRRRVLQPQPVHRARRLPHARGLARRAGPAAAGEGAARAAARRRQGASTDSPVLMRYSLWGLGWSVLAALLRDRHVAALRAGVPGRSPTTERRSCYGVMGTLWVAFFLPVIFVFGKPLWTRFGAAEMASPRPRPTSPRRLHRAAARRSRRSARASGATRRAPAARRAWTASRRRCRSAPARRCTRSTCASPSPRSRA